MVRGDAVKLVGVELRRIRMPLVAPFRTSFGSQTDRDVRPGGQDRDLISSAPTN
jgi:hypothetical protein